MSHFPLFLKLLGRYLLVLAFAMALMFGLWWLFGDRVNWFNIDQGIFIPYIIAISITGPLIYFLFSGTSAWKNHRWIYLFLIGISGLHVNLIVSIAATSFEPLVEVNTYAEAAASNRVFFKVKNPQLPEIKKIGINYDVNDKSAAKGFLKKRNIKVHYTREISYPLKKGEPFVWLGYTVNHSLPNKYRKYWDTQTRDYLLKTFKALDTIDLQRYHYVEKEKGSKPLLKAARRFNPNLNESTVFLKILDKGYEARIRSSQEFLITGLFFLFFQILFLWQSVQPKKVKVANQPKIEEQN